MTIRNEEMNTNTVSGGAYDSPRIDLNEIGSKNMSSIRFTVNGFWSYDPITVYVTREYKRDGSNILFYWKPSISWSSGGRDNKTLPSDIEATHNFAVALQAAASVAAFIEGKSDELEEIYQVHRAEEERLEKEKAAEAQAKIDADPEMGEELANEVFSFLNKTASATSFTAYTRGTRKAKEYTITRTGTGRISIKYANQHVSRVDFINEIKLFSKEHAIR
jgi:hypothetical protein